MRRFSLFAITMLALFCAPLGAYAEPTYAVASGVCGSKLTGTRHYMPYIEPNPASLFNDGRTLSCEQAFDTGCRFLSTGGSKVVSNALAEILGLAGSSMGIMDDFFATDPIVMEQTLRCEFFPDEKTWDPKHEDVYRPIPEKDWQIHPFSSPVPNLIPQPETVRPILYPQALTGLALRLANNLVLAMELSLLELTMDRTTLLVTSVAGGALITDLVTGGAIRSFALKTAGTLPLGMIVSLGMLSLSGQYPNQEIIDAPWTFADLPPEEQAAIEEKYPEVARVVDDFNRDLAHLNNEAISARENDELDLKQYPVYDHGRLFNLTDEE